MVKRSKRLRSQWYQYKNDESGSYSLITDWNPTIEPPDDQGPLRSFFTNNSRRSIVAKILLAAVVVSCIAAVAIGVSVFASGKSGELPDTEAKNEVLLQNTAVNPKSKTTSRPKATGQFESWGDDEPKSHEEDAEPPPSPTILGEFDHAAISADGIPCAQIAKDILLSNGTAADGAIAGMFCVGVINTQSTGLGGGFLMTYYHKASGKAYSLNAREVAASAAYEDMYHGDADLAMKGGLAVAVPGELRGYRELYEKFGGGVSWSDLLEPTIKLCEEGHLVNWHMARALKFNADTIKQEPSMSVFINPETGEVYQEGDILKRPQLAQTLRVLQKDPDALYTGELSYKLVEDIQEFGGIITHEDLVNYKPVWKEAMNVSIQNGGLTMYSVPPPGSGLILGFILNILDEYNLSEESLSDENVVLTHQRITEAMKWAYAKRTELGDADFVDVTSLAKNLTSDAYATEIKGQITDDHTFQDPEHYGAVTAVGDDHGTAHFSLIAQNGDAVAVTGTINLYFGAGIRSAQTGIVLNDEMDDFSLPNITSYFDIPPSPANYIKPGKRPLSSMCPVVFVNSEGNVRHISGAAGGTKISSAVAWAAMRNLWFGDNIKEAIDARRIHHQLFPMTFQYEKGVMGKIVEGMKTIGHETKEFGVGGSVICGIARQNEKIYANSDFRKAGEVDGY